MIKKSEILASPHGFSTRCGGVSKGYYESLNLGMNRGDDIENVKENWTRFLRESGILSDTFVYGKQIHSNIVKIVGEKDMMLPSEVEPPIHADGYATNETNVPLVIFTADCIPLLMEDTISGVVGAFHCGWRGTVADMPQNAVLAMEKLGADRTNIKAALGPSIGKCCFEVGKEVIEQAEALIGIKECAPFYHNEHLGDDGLKKYMLDLAGILTRRLQQLGIGESNIDNIGDCTMCNEKMYYSHRRGGSTRGSLASVIMKICQ